jgi:NitT/TauT family transport system ATP-binding protein
MGTTVFRMEGVRLDFPDAQGRPVPVLQRVDFHVEESELLVVLGPSGCGKSTILRLLAGLQAPTSGRVLYREKPHPGPSQRIGMIFQNYSLFPWLTVRNNISFGPRRRGVKQQEYRARTQEMIKVARLEGLEDRYPSRLSGGQQQRVAIVRSLVNEPDSLLMDEPFGALDIQTRWEMQDFLIETRRLACLTIVFVTHDLEEAVYVGDRIAIASPRPLVLGRQFRVPFPPETRKPALRRDPVFVTLVNKVREALLAAVAASAGEVTTDTSSP